MYTPEAGDIQNKDTRMEQGGKEQDTHTGTTPVEAEPHRKEQWPRSTALNRNGGASAEQQRRFHSEKQSYKENRKNHIFSKRFSSP
jgi:hypothetical protein